MKNISLLQDSVYKNSSIKIKLEAQPIQERFVVFSDLDRTFAYEGKFNETAELYYALEELNIPICICTGQDLPGTLITMSPLFPDICITNVGTEIWIKNSKGYRLDKDFKTLLLNNWNYKTIFAEVNKVAEEITQIQIKSSDLGECDFKISLSVGGERNLLKKIVSSSAKFKNVGFVVSNDWEQSGRFCLDLVPKVNKRAGKNLSVYYLQQKLGKIESIVAGDDLNDAQMLFKSGSHAILVGNSTKELFSYASKFLAKNRLNRKVYIASKEEIGPRAILNAISDDNFQPNLAEKMRKIKFGKNLKTLSKGGKEAYQ